jgi:hypothetical protein
MTLDDGWKTSGSELAQGTAHGIEGLRNSYPDGDLENESLGFQDGYRIDITGYR